MNKTKLVPAEARLLPAEAKRVFKGVIYDVYQWQQQMFDGSRETFEMLKRPDTVEVFAVKYGKVILLNQQQPGYKGDLLGLAGGRVDENEAPIDAAKRELLEETGMSFKNWKLINVVQPQSKIEWFIYTFVATEFLSQTNPQYDPGEKITVSEVEFDEYLMQKDNLRLGGHIAQKYSNLQDVLATEPFEGINIEV